ncbi:hypothetical protein Golob_016212 [Gossypium lobatum]|uniref:Uncharacterized protein n=1 Tax=Gossypium lobatum TaxID=34289 RepID=A0A7J8M3G4_9ROSI|nr:hypothetical protein [Gossypium lobatum]
MTKRNHAGEVPEKILDILEKIGHIDSNQELPIPNSMKKAYCGVALDCTAKYLAGDPNTYAKYLEAVDRIWRGRIQDLEKSKASDLVCEQLRNRRLQVEAAATGDKEVIRCLTEMNTRGRAILSLKHYLLEAFGSMKPPVLEEACLKLGKYSK